MLIFIVGPMASGKSIIGKKLADALGANFIDTDKEIERNAGADISWIFEIEGEEGFRNREMRTLIEISKKENCVIATGGGSVIQKKNREIMTSRGQVVYLETSIQVQLERTLKDKSRPLLRKGNKEETLRSIKKTRDPLYKEIADITIKQEKKSHNKIIQEIMNKLKTQDYE